MADVTTICVLGKLVASENLTPLLYLLKEHLAERARPLAKLNAQGLGVLDRRLFALWAVRSLYSALASVRRSYPQSLPMTRRTRSSLDTPNLNANYTGYSTSFGGGTKQEQSTALWALVHFLGDGGKVGMLRSQSEPYRSALPTRRLHLRLYAPQPLQFPRLDEMRLGRQISDWSGS